MCLERGCIIRRGIIISPKHQFAPIHPNIKVTIAQKPMSRDEANGTGLTEIDFNKNPDADNINFQNEQEKEKMETKEAKHRRFLENYDYGPYYGRIYRKDKLSREVRRRIWVWTETN